MKLKITKRRAVSPRPSAPGAQTAKLIQYGLLALLVLSPLPAASVNEWSILIIELAVFVMAGAYLLASQRPAINPHLEKRLKWPRYAFAALFAFIALQALPLPVFLIRILSPGTYAFHKAFSPGLGEFLSLSVVPAQTFREPRARSYVWVPRHPGGPRGREITGSSPVSPWAPSRRSTTLELTPGTPHSLLQESTARFRDGDLRQPGTSPATWNDHSPRLRLLIARLFLSLEEARDSSSADGRGPVNLLLLGPLSSCRSVSSSPVPGEDLHPRAHVPSVLQLSSCISAVSAVGGNGSESS
jgi:hypothetical protein